MAAAALLLLLWVDSAAAFVPATGLLFPAGGSLRYAASTSSCSTSCPLVLHTHTHTQAPHSPPLASRLASLFHHSAANLSPSSTTPPPQTNPQLAPLLHFHISVSTFNTSTQTSPNLPAPAWLYCIPLISWATRNRKTLNENEGNETQGNHLTIPTQRPDGKEHARVHAHAYSTA